MGQRRILGRSLALPTPTTNAGPMASLVWLKATRYSPQKETTTHNDERTLQLVFHRLEGIMHKRDRDDPGHLMMTSSCSCKVDVIISVGLYPKVHVLFEH